MKITKRAIAYAICALGIIVLLITSCLMPVLKQDNQRSIDTSIQTRSTDTYTIDWSVYVPNIDDYLPEMPVIEVPDTTLAGILPTIKLPVVSFGSSTDLTAPDIQVPTTNEQSIIKEVAVQITVPEMEQVLLTVPKTDYDMTQLTKLYARYERLQTMFRDRRRAYHDNTLMSADNIETWFTIYDNFKGSTIQNVPMDSQQSVRMISEVRLPKSAEQFDILKQNLMYYKGRGYTHALVVFEGTEKASDLVNLCKYVRYCGLYVYSAFGGPESLSYSPYPDAVVLAEQLKAIAQYSEGFILGWRSTSAHLLLQDPAYTDYLASCVRSSNPNIKIIGELYYGNTAQNPHDNQWGFGSNTLKAQSAVLICNFGYSNTDIESVVKKVVPSQVGQYPLFAVVTGQHPYYLTTNPNTLTQEQNQIIKERIERRFIAAGCIGTVTLHDDGRDNVRFSNNLSSTLWINMTTQR